MKSLDTIVKNLFAELLAMSINLRNMVEGTATITGDVS